MMGLFEHWPYVNFHELNLDWIIKEIPKVFAAKDEAQASAEASAESAEASQLSADASQQSADDSQQSADASQQSADSSQESAENAAESEASAKNYADHIADPVAGLVTDWLDDHVTPTTPIVDDTLTISGAAADAKKTGDEITDLKSALDDIGVVQEETTIALSFEYGKMIEADGSISTTSGNYVLNKGNVTAGKTYLVTGTNNFAKLIYAFYDSSDNVVELGTASNAGSTWTEITNESVVAPIGATYIAIEGRYSVFDAQLKEITGEYYYPRVDILESDCEEVKGLLGTVIDKIEQVELTNISDYYVNTNGVVTSASGYNIKRGDVTAGKTYYVTGSTNWANPYYAWYDSSNNLIQLGQVSAAGSAYTSITDAEVVAPAGAEKIVINWNPASVEASLKVAEKKLTGKWYGKKWACVGNSLTDNNQYTTKHYFDFVADATDIIPINMGDSGTGYKRGYDSDRAFYQRILAIDTTVDVVTIFGSFNDIGAGYDLGTYTDTGTTTIAGCINTTIDNLQTLMPTVILGIVAPTPWATARPDFHTNADNYVDMLKKIAEHRSIPFLDLYRASNLRPWDADFRALCYSNDGGNGVHPNELGHKIIAPKFEAFLDSLLLH